ncbi:glycosyltransferase [Erythrobacter crassostreae]|uniref:Glycosyltransferase n=1 Tax=Erythrobacter crassostreae TaxID=2828328 RepID=A0A9X1JNK3_9SPHN|nr:glycosyltransferase [Erythrobacter crassostrea]MBV7258517.1 glycosyltransferase [Erythrobacter crassostrea]
MTSDLTTRWPVHHVVASIAEEASGPSYSVPALAMATADLGRKVAIHTVRGRTLPSKEVTVQTFKQDFATTPVLKSMLLSSDLRQTMMQLPGSSIVHGHGLWLMPNVSSAAIGARPDISVIHAPRGMLGANALRFSRQRKRVFWHLFQKQAAKHVACWHATSEKEISDIRDFGLRQPVALIPNGIDFPNLKARSVRPERRTVLFLGRIHPKKGIDTLLRVWKSIEDKLPGWHLAIAGPDDNQYADEYKRYIEKEGAKTAKIVGPVYGSDKVQAYRDAELFVLPTLDENFGMTVAEALVQETPAIVSHGAPWEGLETNDCGWWHAIGEAPLRDALLDATSRTDEQRMALGANGRAWMQREFGWPSLANGMEDVYSWLSGQADQPDCVVTD